MRPNPAWEVLFAFDDGWTVFARNIAYPWINFIALEPSGSHHRRRGYNGGFSLAESRFSKSSDFHRLYQDHPTIHARVIESFTQRYNNPGPRHAP